MALFPGEEMVDVTTPDGRTITVPRSLVPANMMPQQIAPGGPITAPQYGGPGTSPQEIPGGFAPPDFGTPANPYEGRQPAPGTGVVEMGEPETQSVTVMDPLEVGARPAVMKRMTADKAKAAKAKAAYAASPEGKLESAQNQQNAAANAEAAAIAESAIAQAAEEDVRADAVEARNVQIDDYVAKRAADMQAAADEQERKYGEITSLKTKIANFKVDRTADRPILAALAIAIAGFGSALKGESVNPGLEAFDKAIERKVAAQMADLDQMGKIYGMTKEELAILKEKGKSKLELWNTMIAGETEKGIRHLEEITARSASDRTKGNAKIIIAQLQARVAEKTMVATQWGLDFAQKEKHQKAQIGVQYANIAESKRSSMASEQLQRERMVLDAADRDAAQAAARGAAASKEWADAEEKAQKYAIKGADNEYLLTQEGRDKMALAATREAEALALEAQIPALMDPQNVAAKEKRITALRQSANQLRGDARVRNVVKLRNDTIASKVPTAKAAGQSMIDVIDQIMLIDPERALIGGSKEQQEARALYKLLAVKGKDAWQLGAWDKGTAVLSKDIYGEDPTKWSESTMRGYISDVLGDDPDGYRDRLKVVATDIENSTRLQVQNNSDWDGKGALFTRKKPPDMNNPVDKASADLTQARTGADVSRAALKSVGEIAADEARARGYKPTQSISEQANEERMNSGVSLKYPGLSKAQEAPFEILLATYKKRGPDSVQAGDQLVAKVVNEAERNPELALPLLRTLKEHAPALGVAARVALPKDGPADKQMVLEANNELARAPIPAHEMATMIIATMNGDGTVTAEGDYSTLWKRAGTGDQAAKQALADIQAASSRHKPDRQGPKRPRGGR